MTKPNKTEEGLQWLRVCSLALADKNNAALDLGELHIVFKTIKNDAETPNSAEMRIYNLSASTASKMQREFTRVVLQAGYKDNYGIIFDGNICSTRIGKENGIDTWLEITAADGDKAYNFSTVNTTLAAGSTPIDRINACQ